MGQVVRSSSHKFESNLLNFKLIVNLKRITVHWLVMGDSL